MSKLHLLSQHNSLPTGKPCYSAIRERIAPPKHCLGVSNAVQIGCKETRRRGQLIGAISSSGAAVQPYETLTRPQNTLQPVGEVDKGRGILEGRHCRP